MIRGKIIFKYIKYFFIFFVMVILVSCANEQRKASRNFALKVDIFKKKHNANIEFLSYIDTSTDFSYIVDTHLTVKKIIYPDISLMQVNSTTIAVEFVDKEMFQSFPLLQENSSILFQEGILIINGDYHDIEEGTNYKKFIICRQKDCRDISKMALRYMYNYNGIDENLPEGYKSDDLLKYLTD